MTDFIIRGRSGGKTTELLERMVRDERIVYIAPTEQQAVWAWNQSAPLNGGERLPRARFVRWDALPRGRRETPLAIDNVEGILTALFGHPIDSVTGTDARYSITAETSEAAVASASDQKGE